MPPGLTALVIFLAFLALLATGLPVAFCLLGISALGYFIIIGPQGLHALFSVAFDSLTKDILIAIPLYIFMAAVLEVSGLGARLYDLMYKWMAGLRGGLAMGSVLAATILAAMTGIGATATVMMGLIAYPEMRRRNYDKILAIGCIPAGGALGPIIPPSIPMILVASFTGLSVGKLFIGGLIPGLIMSLGFIVYIGVKCFLNPALGPALPVENRATWRQKFLSLRGSVLPIILILVVLGGIYSGICTPTEAGGVGAAGALICAAVYRNLNWKNLSKAVTASFRVNAMVLWLIIGGSCFSSILSISGVSHLINDVLGGLPLPPMGIISVMLAIVFFLGMFTECTSILIICTPLFMPVVLALGFDPLWFAIVFVITTIIGMISPPFGINLFYFAGLRYPDVSMADIYRSVWVYVWLMLIVVILCVIFPDLATWLPNIMIK